MLICAPTGQDAALTASVLGSVGIDSEISSHPALLAEQLAPGAGALLLVEEVLSGGGLQSLVDDVAAPPTWSDLPILLLTRSGADSLAVQGAVDHL